MEFCREFALEVGPGIFFPRYPSVPMGTGMNFEIGDGKLRNVEMVERY